VHDLAAAITARDPRAATDGEVHLTTGVQQLVGDLAARLAAADDEDAAVGQLLRAAVRARVQLEHVRGDALGERRRRRALVGARGHNDVGGLERVAIELQPKPCPRDAQPPDLHTGAHRRRDRGGVAVEVRDRLLERGEGFGIRAGVLATR
jgi:hypothetical protein